MAADPEFLAEAAKAKLPIKLTKGEEVQASVARIHAAPPAIVERAMTEISARRKSSQCPSYRRAKLLLVTRWWRAGIIPFLARLLQPSLSRQPCARIPPASGLTTGQTFARRYQTLQV